MSSNFYQHISCTVQFLFQFIIHWDLTPIVINIMNPLKLQQSIEN